MIIGFVTPALKAAIHISLIGQKNIADEIEIFVDTGFNGGLSLPLDLITRCGFPTLEEAVVQLADGSHITVTIYQGRVLWEGKEREIDVVASEGDALLGMRLLEGSEVTVQVTDGGAVSIEPMD